MSVTLQERPATGTPPPDEPSTPQRDAWSRRLTIVVLLLGLVITNQVGAVLSVGDLRSHDRSLVVVGPEVPDRSDVRARPPARLSLPNSRRRRGTRPGVTAAASPTMSGTQAQVPSVA